MILFPLIPIIEGGVSFSAEDVKDLGRNAQIVSSSFYSANNKGNSPTYILYGSTNNSSWTELGRISHGGGSFSINITDKNYYRYVKVYQSTSQWRRDDGNEVCSIEPWSVRFRYH